MGQHQSKKHKDEKDEEGKEKVKKEKGWKKKKQQQQPVVEEQKEDSDPNDLTKPLEQLRQEEGPLLALARVTYFDVPTLRKLQRIYEHISSSRENDGIIDLHVI